MKTIKLGDFNTLEVVKRVDFGLYLDGGNEEEILLPNRYVPENVKIGDKLEVFIYLDNDEKLIATTERPLAKVGEFAYLEVAWVNEYGAFLKWGPMKDLFCPFREQKRRMEIGEKHMVYIYIDEESYRIAASAKVEHFINDGLPPYKHGDEVSIQIWQKTDLGFKVIIDNEFAGLAYESQIFKRIHTGEKMTGYIDNVRPDHKIDITLQPTGQRQALSFADKLLQYLREHGGKCELGDKSDAEEIRRRFQVSKKVYKKAIGDLYKRRLITIGEEGITLV